jgi:hypothetical protein
LSEHGRAFRETQLLRLRLHAQELFRERPGDRFASTYAFLTISRSSAVMVAGGISRSTRNTPVPLASRQVTRYVAECPMQILLSCTATALTGPNTSGGCGGIARRRVIDDL